MRRVVISGLGIVSCIGNNQSEVLDSLLKTRSGIVFSEETPCISGSCLVQLCGWPVLRLPGFPNL